MPDFPPYATKALVAERLPIIFPNGIENRIYCTRDMAASTVFAMIYVGAVEGANQYLGPVHVYRMTDEQADLTADAEREAYANGVVRGQYVVPGARWYADNSREPIRDETLREGLVAVGAVLARTDLPTTSGKPRYALKGSFAKLFNPALDGQDLEDAIADFQRTSLSRGALARVSIMLSGAAANGNGVQVTFPNSGETRQMAPGPSSLISRAVVEVFAPRFMADPVVLWLSESGNKVVARDDKLAARIGLKIEADKNLPDLILADLGPAEPILLFVEVVATDGAVTARRKSAILEMTDAARFDRKHVKFLTAYQDRGTGGFKKTVQSLAWGSLAWFASEPDHIIVLHDVLAAPPLAMPG